MSIFRVLKQVRDVKKGYQHPDEFLSDVSFGVIEAYFTTSFIVLGLLLTGTFWGGFIEGIFFLKVFFVLFLLITITVWFVFRGIKKFIARISKSMTDRARHTYNEVRSRNVIDVPIAKD